jgi:hypothetical protein
MNPVGIVASEASAPVLSVGALDTWTDKEGTPRIERRSRESRASRAAQRYGLPVHVALLVVDNKMTIADALHRTAVVAARKAELEEGLASWIGWAGAAAAVLCLLIGAAIWSGTVGFDDGSIRRAGVGRVMHEVPVPTIRTSVEVHTNVQGLVTGIRALEPETVLAAYCESFKVGARPAPVRIASTAQGDRLGIFNVAGRLYAIEIHKEPNSLHWIAGNDKDPIVRIDPPSPSHT